MLSFIWLTLFCTIASAAIIPLRPIRISTNVHHAHISKVKRASFYKREDDNTRPIATTTIYLTVGGDQPTDTPLSSATSTALPSSTTATPVLPSSTVESASTPSQTPVVDNNGTIKYVVAHHMVGNTFPYTLQDWADDIALAHASGIDGFALNMGIDDWQPARVADA